MPQYIARKRLLSSSERVLQLVITYPNNVHTSFRNGFSSLYPSNVKGVAYSDVVKYLDQHGICVRGGIHCAILAHETIGTVETGAVRVSVNSFNTAAEIDEFIRVIGAL